MHAFRLTTDTTAIDACIRCKTERNNVDAEVKQANSAFIAECIGQGRPCN